MGVEFWQSRFEGNRWVPAASVTLQSVLNNANRGMGMKMISESGQLEELKRTARILEIVQIITVAPKRYHCRDFAERFEISERMVKKDMEIIRHGLKLLLRASNTGYYFEATPVLPAVQFPFADALALLMAVQATQQVSGVSSPELSAAISRLETQFPLEFVPLLRRLSLQPPMTAHGKHRQQMLMLLNKALLEERKVRLIYETRSRSGAITERVVRPFHLMPYVRSWQLIAYCELRGDILMFKLDRIQEATLLDDRYHIDPNFNLDSYLGWAWGIIRGDSQVPEQVELHFEANTGHRVMEEEWHPSQEAEILPDGRVKFTFKATITQELIAWLLYYGSRVEVFRPEWLQETIREEHLRAAEVNQCSQERFQEMQ